MELKLLLLVPIAFVCEFCDSSLGMGYGTILTPVLLLFFGFGPLEVVPAVLMSEFVTGLAAAFAHHRFRNVRFERRSLDTKVAAVLSVCSMVGTVAAVFIATQLVSKDTLTLMIGIVIVAMGVIIIATLRRPPRFTWGKITAVGVVASFNKGLSGGGYGPLVMGGQMLSGIGVKNAVGITSLAESLTCLVGTVLYVLFKGRLPWHLAPYLMIGALLSVPFAALTVKKAPEWVFKPAVAAVITILGCLTLAKAFGWA
jgi:uncharacterized membrane protein YfcA